MKLVLAALLSISLTGCGLYMNHVDAQRREEAKKLCSIWSNKEDVFERCISYQVCKMSADAGERPGSNCLPFSHYEQY